jgi:hypothetical protein
MPAGAADLIWIVGWLAFLFVGQGVLARHAPLSPCQAITMTDR